MSYLTQPIGILGGTFDPVHFGHLHIALELQQAYNLAGIRFIPCWQPVHRASPIATPEQRLAMLVRAVANESTLKVDDCEIQRKGPSYMVETIETLRGKFPNTPLCLILGVDAWSGFTTWQRYEDILRLSHLIIAQRPSYLLPETGTVAVLLQRHLTQDASTLRKSLGGHILLHPVTSLEISATAIRNQIAQGQDPRYLLPDSVYDYIVKHHLYNA
jgi:nicotinate-nucleotide adenylyltransferase